MPLRTLAILALAAALAGACASATIAPVPAAPLAWPAPPLPARIVYERAVSVPEDLGIEKTFLQRVGNLLFGATDPRMVRPSAVLDTGDAVFVADPGARGVHRFDRRAASHRLIGLDDEKGLPSPVGLALGAGGTVYVTDSALAAVFTIAPGADRAMRAPFEGLRQPTGIAFDPQSQQLYVADTALHQVVKFAGDGRRLATIGERGIEPGRFNFPTMLWRDRAGILYVTDTLNFRIQSFDPEGRFVRAFGRHGDGSGDSARPKGVATDSAGRVYVVDALFNAFQVFDAEGRLLLGVGEAGQAPGEFWLPTGIFVTSDDRVLVADTYNRRIQVFRIVGGST